jgi:hypothetical protein
MNEDNRMWFGRPSGRGQLFDVHLVRKDMLAGAVEGILPSHIHVLTLGRHLSAQGRRGGSNCAGDQRESRFDMHGVCCGGRDGEGDQGKGNLVRDGAIPTLVSTES